jgi:hypothetical protein
MNFKAMLKPALGATGLGVAGFFVLGPLGAIIGATVGGGIGAYFQYQSGASGVTPTPTAPDAISTAAAQLGIPLQALAMPAPAAAAPTMKKIGVIRPAAAPAVSPVHMRFGVGGSPAPSASGMSVSQAAAAITSLAQSLLASIQPDPSAGTILAPLMHQVVQQNLNTLVQTPTASNLSTVINTLSKPGQGNEAASVAAQLSTLRARIGYSSGGA